MNYSEADTCASLIKIQTEIVAFGKETAKG